MQLKVYSQINMCLHSLFIVVTGSYKKQFESTWSMLKESRFQNFVRPRLTLLAFLDLKEKWNEANGIKN